MRKLLSYSALITFSLTSAMLAWSIDREGLAEALNGAHRSAENKARDIYRHPMETLDFFGIEPTMTVVESWPGGGWYTEVLAPYLKDKGKLIGAQGRANKNWDAMLDANPDVYGKTVRVDLSKDAMAAPESVDAILDFRNAHNWIGSAERHDGLLKSWHTVLKPGGIVGIVDHRQDADSTVTGRTGYIKEQDLIDKMAEYGFEFVAKSEVNANPKDTKDHAGGVWSLPPVMRLGEENKEKYMAIGESDRLTMKFKKK
jgi:predicted methyltransferase